MYANYSDHPGNFLRRLATRDLYRRLRATFWSIEIAVDKTQSRQKMDFLNIVARNFGNVATVIRQIPRVSSRESYELAVILRSPNERDTVNSALLRESRFHSLRQRKRGVHVCPLLYRSSISLLPHTRDIPTISLLGNMLFHYFRYFLIDCRIKQTGISKPSLRYLQISLARCCI